MHRDARALPLSTDSAQAASLFDQAVEHYLKYHLDTMALVNEALAADPHFVMGHCLKGYYPPSLTVSRIYESMAPQRSDGADSWPLKRSP
jgi:hypothetical protein